MKAGSLFSGYGGLDLAIEQVFGAELAWCAEFDPAPSKIMARHWPDAPNYGDVTTVDWATVEPVDIISGGSPCQDVSAAGRRAGMNEGTRSNLWVAMREAIATIKPTYVVWENVRGAHSARAHSKVESEPGLLGESRGAYLRATGRVVGDLASLGYDTQWRTVTASSVGAPHRRERVFVLAWRRDATTADRDSRRDRGRTTPPGQGGGERADAPALLATRAPGGTGTAHPVALLPTVRAQNDSEQNSHIWEREQGLPQNLENALAHTLSDPLLDDPPPGQKSYRAGDDQEFNGWGVYEAAIRRWERALGIPAPSPTELSPRGKHRLSEHFTEWMMGLPAGWICDTPGITRNDKIKAAGNGVVPQQAAAALADMLTHIKHVELEATE